MWGDPAGYYVYNPALFIYGFDSRKLPENVVEKTGQGFIINEKGKIVTRYTCGVAMLQAPVFLGIHVFTGLKHDLQDGFSGAYHLVSSISAILYAFFGLILLWKYLRFFFNRVAAFLALMTVFWGTNLLYYTIDATGMSHIYSFFLFSALLVVSKNFFSGNQHKHKKILFFLMALLSALIILIRPTNLAFILLAGILDVTSLKELKNRILSIFSVPNIFILLITFFLIFLPQMIYWKYASGKFITDSYEGYGFSNLSSPKIIEFLFSTNNGLFPYNPVYLFVLISLLFMIIRKQYNGAFILVLSLILIYVFSSWFIFSFGCGFGSRNFVEYTTVFSLSAGYFYQHYLKKIVLRWIFIFPIVIALCLVNVKLTRSYNKCFIEGDWNWKEYIYLLQLSKHKENVHFKPALTLNQNEEFSKPLTVNLSDISKVSFRRAIVQADVRVFENNSAANLVFQISTSDSIIYWNSIKLSDQNLQSDPQAIYRYKGDFWLPKNYNIHSQASAFIWNLEKDSLEVSYISIQLE